MTTMLLAGFQPFGGQDVNPALEALRRLPAQLGDIALVRVEVPVTYELAAPTVAAAVAEHEPAAVVCVGQAAGRACVTVERVAINVDDSDAPDNAGVVRRDVPIERDGPAAYFATLPVRDMVRAVESAGLPCQVSNSAGTYVCNHLMYETLHLASRQRPQMLAGFVHVPLLPSQTLRGEMRGRPAMSGDDVVTSLMAAIGAVAEVL